MLVDSEDIVPTLLKQHQTILAAGISIGIPAKIDGLGFVFRWTSFVFQRQEVLGERDFGVTQGITVDGIDIIKGIPKNSPARWNPESHKFHKILQKSKVG